MINIQSDSRKIKPGDTFIALRGISSDGHSYIKNAIAAGATKIVAEEGNYSVETELVSNTREYLNEYLVKHYQNQISTMRMLGVTGTNGKTTTSWFLSELLTKLGEKTAYIGTIGFYINNQKIRSLPNTTVDTCEMYDLLMEAYKAGCKNVILEVSSHALAMGRVKTLVFDGAIFTNLTQDHLDYHKTMKNYALAKQILFKQVQKNGIGVVNIDDVYASYFQFDHLNLVTYGFEKADYQVKEYAMDRSQIKFTYLFEEKPYMVETNLIGSYNIYNVLAAIALLHAFNYNLEVLSLLVSELNPPVGRLDTVCYQDNLIVIDYAHTPDAIQKIILTMKKITKHHLYVVFGCTGDRDRTKRPLMTELVADLADYFIITNDDPHFEDPSQIVEDMLASKTYSNYEVCLDRKQAIIQGIQKLTKDDTLLILGKGHEEVMIIGKKSVPFNDKKVVLEYLGME